MTKWEFLGTLSLLLSALPREEIDAAMSYYEEYISDAEDEAEAIASLGPPWEVASRITAGTMPPEFTAWRATERGKGAALSQRGIGGVVSLAVNSTSADIEFIPADDFGFDILTFSGKPAWRVERGTLIVEEGRAGGTFHIGFPPTVINLGSLGPPGPPIPPGSYIKIYYPKGSALNKLAVKGVSGEVKFPGLDSRVREASFVTMSGDVAAASFEADSLMIHTVSGDIEARGIASPGAHLKTTSGDIALTGLSGRLDAHTVSGDVTVSDVADEDRLEYKLGTVSGSIFIGGRRIRGSVQSSPPNAESSLDITTVSGDIAINN
ncbi:MAG: DUF4097 family beta strand repeat-containing protein [Oscillospiraceae bacterium]|nr:DUF4097 family beta strand repeat-containing protein [Oscillospiraceae bacterium]